MTAATDTALSVMASLRLEDGKAWGSAATAHQWADAKAVLDVDGPRRHWLGRPRGFSKTSDCAGLMIAILLCQLPPGSMVYAAASDRDQAALVLNAVRGFAARTPELRSQLTVQTDRVIADRTGSTLSVISADAASAYGLLPAALIVDELCQWPRSTNAREMWSALTSALPKVPGSRLIVLTTAGDPSHWSRKIYEQAERSPMWRVSNINTPAPWQDPAEVAEQRASLLPSVFARLFMNQWTASEDRLVDPADLDAALCLPGDVSPVAGKKYVASLDLGLKHDATVAVVAHREHVDGGDVVVVDRLRRWRGSRAQPLEIGLVEQELVSLSTLYNRAPVIADPWQAMGLIQRLKARGIRAEEHAFTSQSVGRLAHGLYGLLRGRRLHLPNDEVLREELLAVRLRETQPGQYRLEHQRGKHDDQAVAIALAAHALIAAGGKPKPNIRFM